MNDCIVRYIVILFCLMFEAEVNFSYLTFEVLPLCCMPLEWYVSHLASVRQTVSVCLQWTCCRLVYEKLTIVLFNNSATVHVDSCSCANPNTHAEKAELHLVKVSAQVFHR